MSERRREGKHTPPPVCVKSGKSGKSPGEKPGQSKQNERAENLCKTQKNKTNRERLEKRHESTHTHICDARTMSEEKVLVWSCVL